MASRTIGEGVDGLQDVGSRVVINSLPWHKAAWEQLLGRWHRQGQRRDVEVVVPVTWYETKDGPSSLDLMRLHKIAVRGTYGDAILDGVLPRQVVDGADLIQQARRELEKLVK